MLLKSEEIVRFSFEGSFNLVPFRKKSKGQANLPQNILSSP